MATALEKAFELGRNSSQSTGYLPKLQGKGYWSQEAQTVHVPAKHVCIVAPYDPLKDIGVRVAADGKSITYLGAQIDVKVPGVVIRDPATGREVSVEVATNWKGMTLGVGGASWNQAVNGEPQAESVTEMDKPKATAKKQNRGSVLKAGRDTPEQVSA